MKDIKDKLKNIFEEILKSEVVYFSYTEENILPRTFDESKKVLTIEYKEVKEEKKITEKQLKLLKRLLERGNNKELLREKFNLGIDEIDKISFQRAKEILSFFLEVVNGK
ncbi:MAG: hypothetical protein CBR30_01720 [Dictyoglomus sp. NZ13-RE01]|nr:MAG: hypothetical protein CBR30_01720 [Dictyoglomus sp. NZ13-RE01]